MFVEDEGECPDSNVLSHTGHSKNLNGQRGEE